MAQDGFFAGIAKTLFGRRAKAPMATAPTPPAPPTQTRVSGEYETDWREMFAVDPSRTAAYRDYVTMSAESGVVDAALAQLSDGAASGADGDFDKVFDVTFGSDTQKDKGLVKAVQDRIDDVDRRLQLRASSREHLRELAFMGDIFGEMVFDGEKEISSLQVLPPESIVKIPENGPYRPDQFAYRQYNRAGERIAELYDWQMAHFKLAVRPTDLYGQSMLYAARRPYKQLQAIEDGMVINRLTRSSSTRAWSVPVGDAVGAQAGAVVDEYERRNRRTRRFDPRTGKLLVATKVMDEERDIYIATGPKIGNGAVTTLQPQSGMEKIEDVMYFHRKLVAAIGVPAAYLGFEKDTRDKAVITALDVAFARRLRALQRAWGRGLRTIFDTQLLLDEQPANAFDYTLAFAPVATVDEVRAWQIETLKVAVAQQLKDAGLVMDIEFLLTKILEMEPKDVATALKGNAKAKEEQEIETLRQQAMFDAQAAAPEGPVESRRHPRVRVSSEVREATEYALSRAAVVRSLRSLRSLATPLLLEREGGRAA